MNQDRETTEREVRVRPIHQVRYGNVKAAVWGKDTEHGRRFSVTVSRSYTTTSSDGTDEWHDSDSFGRDDLLVLAKALNDCHTWIHAQK